VLLGIFGQWLVYFLKSYLETHKRIKLQHVWQSIMPQIREETL